MDFNTRGYKFSDETLTEAEIAQLDGDDLVAVRFYDGIVPKYDVIGVVSDLIESTVFNVSDTMNTSLWRVEVA